MFIIVVGLNHRTAPIDVREKLALTGTTLNKALCELKEMPGIEGCVILSTCNRFEIYCAVREIEQGLKTVKDFISSQLAVLNTESAGFDQYLYAPTCHDAISHLFRVAAGLDSMVIGESQVLGQVRDAYELALNQEVTNGVINTLFQQAITVGKRVRTEIWTQGIFDQKYDKSGGQSLFMGQSIKILSIQPNCSI
jgi:glutamyl-tRNA reductase